ncbi:MAG: BrnA antitoxin family protein [Ramlibacter sp.]
MDKETEQFAADVLESIRQARRGEYARIHTPEEIMARAARRGRPPGSVSPTTKQAVKLRLDPDLLAALRASGAGWQTRVNAILRQAVLSK